MQNNSILPVTLKKKKKNTISFHKIFDGFISYFKASKLIFMFSFKSSISR